MLSATVIVSLLFQFGLLLYLSSFTAVARTPKIMLNRSGKTGHPCLDLRGNAFNFSLLRMMLAVAMFGLYYVEVGSL